MIMGLYSVKNFTCESLNDILSAYGVWMQILDACKERYFFRGTVLDSGLITLKKLIALLTMWVIRKCQNKVILIHFQKMYSCIYAFIMSTAAHGTKS